MWLLALACCCCRAWSSRSSPVSCAKLVRVSRESSKKCYNYARTIQDVPLFPYKQTGDPLPACSTGQGVPPCLHGHHQTVALPIRATTGPNIRRWCRIGDEECSAAQPCMSTEGDGVNFRRDCRVLSWLHGVHLWRREHSDQSWNLVWYHERPFNKRTSVMRLAAWRILLGRYVRCRSARFRRTRSSISLNNSSTLST